MSNDRKTKPLVPPLALAALAAAAIGATVWALDVAPYSETQPYADGREDAPTGAGSLPDGIAAQQVDGVTVTEDPSAMMAGSTDANDLTGIEETDGPQNRVEDDGRRLLSADEVIAPEEGDVNPETGLVRSDASVGLDASDGDDNRQGG